jgi:hypothetical protein
MTITTILQIYKRPDYFEEQLAAIDSQSIRSDKIFIVHNEGDVKFNIPERSDITYFYIKPNRKFHPRFSIGLLAETDYIFFFDDDTIPGEHLFQTAINLINEKDCIVVGNGRILYPEQKQWGCPGWGNPTPDPIECDFGGHFWGLKKKHLQYMWREEPIRYDNCEDMMLSFNCFRFGNIRTFTTPHPLNDKTKWSSLKGAEFGSDSVASWIVNPSHFQDRWDTIDTYIKNGYKPLINR